MYEDLFIENHHLGVGHIINEFIPNGDVITSGEQYNLPSALLDGMTDDAITALIGRGFLRIYGVQDNSGRLHLNKHDVDRLQRWMLNGWETATPIQKRRKTNAWVEVLIIDYRSPEYDKQNLFKDLLLGEHA